MDFYLALTSVIAAAIGAYFTYKSYKKSQNITKYHKPYSAGSPSNNINNSNHNTIISNIKITKIKNEKK